MQEHPDASQACLKTWGHSPQNWLCCREARPALGRPQLCPFPVDLACTGVANSLLLGGDQPSGESTNSGLRSFQPCF